MRGDGSGRGPRRATRRRRGRARSSGGRRGPSRGAGSGAPRRVDRETRPRRGRARQPVGGRGTLSDQVASRKLGAAQIGQGESMRSYVLWTLPPLWLALGCARPARPAAMAEADTVRKAPAAVTAAALAPEAFAHAEKTRREAE